MTPRRIKTRTVDRARYVVYWQKAREFQVTMQLALMGGRWNSAGLAAVHCVISCTDALLAHASGIRCTSEDHRDAVYLLRLHLKDADATKNALRLQGILAQKSVIEYEDRVFSQDEAEQIVEQANRFAAWAASRLPA